MDTIFMNSEKSKTSKPHVVIFKLTEKLDWRSGEKNIAFQVLVFALYGKTGKAHPTLDLK